LAQAQQSVNALCDVIPAAPHHTGRSPFTVTRVPARVCGQ
jgi:hypothetical protein